MNHRIKTLTVMIVTLIAILLLFAGCSDMMDKMREVMLQSVALIFSAETGTYDSPVALELSNTTSGAIIYYTIDGSDPSTGSAKYTGALTISENTTVKAISIHPFLEYSDITSATYMIRAGIPQISLVETSDPLKLKLTLTSVTVDADIHYTLDGTDPAETSEKFDSGTNAWVEASTTVKAFARKANMLDSAVATKAYSLVTLNFDKNGGNDPNPVSKTVATGAEYGDLATTTRTGYTFVGWFTEAGGTGTEVTSATTVTTTANDQTLYAKWAADPHTLSFDANGGTGSMGTVTQNTDEVKNLPANSFARTGYTFAGWATSAAGPVVHANQASYTMGTTNATLYAKWTADAQTLSFDKNGGTGTMVDVALVTDQVTTLPSNFFSKTGYTFAGWAINSINEVAYANQASYTMGTANATLHAKWTANSQILSFDKNGGTGSMVDVFLVSDQNTTLPVNTFVRTGYTFAGWATSAAGSVVHAEKASYTMGTANATLYAKWTANSQTLSFDKNGGTGSMVDVFLVSDQNTNLPANSFARTGYTFAGWATSDSGVMVHANQASYIMGTANATLYANWTVNTYTVTFDKNGGTDPNPSNKTVTFGQTYGDLATTTRTGYTFVGWFTEAGATGTEVTSATSVTTTAAGQTLYAKWTADSHTLSFDANGGTGTMGAVTQNTDEVKNLPANNFVRTGYTFAGWATSSSGSKMYNDKVSYTMGTANATLYAKWTADAQSLSFDNNGGEGTMVDVALVTDQVTTLPSNTFTKTGYTFAGWATSSDGEVVHVDQASYTMGAANAMLYAKWTVNTYTVIFNKNGGSDLNPSSKAVTYGQTYGDLATTTRAGYTFVGWFTEADGTGTEVTSATSVTTTAAGQTLYAKWTANSQTLSFDANGGTGTMDAVTQNTDEAKNLPANSFVRTGYTFAGWATSSSGSKMYNDKVSYTMGSSNTTLYAKWTADSHMLSFDANGGTGTMGAVTQKTDEEKNLPANTFSKSGYTFEGWATSAAGEVAYANQASYIMGATNATLYAKWEVITYSLGEVGPAGGRIFFDKGVFDNTVGTFVDNIWVPTTRTDVDGKLITSTKSWRYLEAANFDIESNGYATSTKYSAFGFLRNSDGIPVEVGGTSTDIGTGQTNSNIFLNAIGIYSNIDYNSPSTTQYYAVRLCDNYVEGGYNDWFIPSKDELNQLYLNSKVGLGYTFSDRLYFSSSEYDYVQVWAQGLKSGGTNTYPKHKIDYYAFVRPVRAF